MKRYAQIYNGKVIYIIDSYASIEDLAKHFSKDTIWMDITDNNTIEVGYIQSIDNNGNIIFIPSLEDEFEKLSEIDKFNAILIAAKVQRDIFLDSVAVQYKYINAQDCYNYNNYMSTKLKDIRDKMDDYINTIVPNMNRISEARDIDFRSKAKELKLI